MAKTNAPGTSAAAAARAAAAAASPKRKAAPKLPKSVAAAVRVARDKQALDIVVLDLRKADGFTDYFVICTGNSGRQIHAVAAAIEDTLRTELGERPTLAEGIEKSEWILLDYFNFVVHVFSRDCRAFYGLERLWGSAQRIEFPDEPPAKP